MTIRLSLNLPKDVTDSLKQLAGKNYRTVTAEVLIALKKHIREEEAKGKTDAE